MAEHRALLLEQLTRKTQVGYRSSEQISREDAFVSYVESQRRIQVEFRLAQLEPVFIDIRNIDNIRQKDYPEDNSFRWVLAVNLNPADSRNIMLQFTAREVRDTWVAGLRALVEASRSGGLGGSGSSSSGVGGLAPQMSRGGGSSSSNHLIGGGGTIPTSGPPLPPPNTERAITDVALREPRPGFLARVELTLGLRELLALEVPEGCESSERLSRLVQGFVDNNAIMPNESTSLFRFVKNAVHRIVLERETEALVEEIGCQHLDVLMRDRLAASGKGDIQEIRKAAMREAEYNLRVLAEEVPKRIGQCGTGAAIVCMILQRNIEKMKLINDMTAKAYEAESEVVNKVTESGW